jgi:hypothetical protein
MVTLEHYCWSKATIKWLGSQRLRVNSGSSLAQVARCRRSEHRGNYHRGGEVRGLESWAGVAGEHYLADHLDRQTALSHELVVELLQTEARSLCLLVVGTQLVDL